jgi:hypothetical protein
MSGFFSRATAFTAVALAGVSACSSGSAANASVSAAELQRALVANLARAGTSTTWVNCGKDLAARVGATTRCDVMFNQADTVTAVLTTTQVRGDAVTWEITRAEMTKDQVTKRVAGLWLADTVTCGSGLDGNVGDWVECEVAKGGVTMTQTLEVNSVRGLSLDINPTLSLSKQQAEDLVRSRVTAAGGQSPESASCPGDLVGSTGTAMDCVATIAGAPQTYTLSVLDAASGTVNLEAAVPAPGEAAPDLAAVQAAPDLTPMVAASQQAPPQVAPVPIQAAPVPVRAVPVPVPVRAAPAPAPRRVVPPPAAGRYPQRARSD